MYCKMADVQKALNHITTLIKIDFSEYISDLNRGVLPEKEVEKCQSIIGDIISVMEEFNILRLPMELCEDSNANEYLIAIIDISLDSINSTIGRLQNQYVSEVLSTNETNSDWAEIISTSISHAISLLKDIVYIITDFKEGIII